MFQAMQMQLIKLNKLDDLEKNLENKNDKVDKLEKRIIDVQARSMRDNLGFYNIQETESVGEEITSETKLM